VTRKYKKYYNILPQHLIMCKLNGIAAILAYIVHCKLQESLPFLTRRINFRYGTYRRQK
jgi:hypothetical protein